MKKITFLLIALLVAMVSYSQIIIEEDFNGANIPTGWSTNMAYGTHNWHFGNNGAIHNASFSTQAALFDDDAAGNTGNRNAATLSFPIQFNVLHFSKKIVLSYEYILQTVSNTGNDHLSVYLYNIATNTVIPLVNHTQDTIYEEFEIDITNIVLANLTTLAQGTTTLNFNFDDVDGSWEWGAGIDTVLLQAIPRNDACSDAFDVSNSFPVDTTINVDGTTNNDGSIAVTGCGSMNDGVWYTFIAAGDGDLNIQSHTGSFDHEIAAYTGSCGNFTCVDNVDDDLAGFPEYLTIAVTYGTQYWINFGHWGGGLPSGNLQIHMSYGGTENDTCADGQDQGAVNLPVQTNMANFSATSPYSGTVLGASDSGVAATVCEGDTGTPNDDVWFKFTATTVDVHVTVEESFDSVINLYSGTCGSLSQIGCANNSDASPVELDASGLTIGDEYYIRVFSFNDVLMGDAGFNISVWTENAVASTQNDIIEGLSLYPNPVNDILSIESQEEITQLNVYSVLGKLVKKVQPNATNSTIDLSDLATGIYMVKIEAGNKVSTQKIIKQ